MNLVWKLLRRHVSVPQFAGFFFANLLGMLIVLLSVQFYYDVLPVFTQGDSFIKKDYLLSPSGSAWSVPSVAGVMRFRGGHR